jgi:hypothetical protein
MIEDKIIFSMISIILSGIVWKYLMDSFFLIIAAKDKQIIPQSQEADAKQTNKANANSPIPQFLKKVLDKHAALIYIGSTSRG